MIKSIQHTDTKRYFKSRIGKLYILLYIILALNLSFTIFCVHHFAKIEKKIDHRYFNTTRTLEDIHGVNINTFDGKIIEHR